MTTHPVERQEILALYSAVRFLATMNSRDEIQQLMSIPYHEAQPSQEEVLELLQEFRNYQLNPLGKEFLPEFQRLTSLADLVFDEKSHGITFDTFLTELDLAATGLEHAAVSMCGRFQELIDSGAIQFRTYDGNSDVRGDYPSIAISNGDKPHLWEDSNNIELVTFSSGEPIAATIKGAFGNLRFQETAEVEEAYFGFLD